MARAERRAAGTESDAGRPINTRPSSTLVVVGCSGDGGCAGVVFAVADRSLCPVFERPVRLSGDLAFKRRQVSRPLYGGWHHWHVSKDPCKTTGCGGAIVWHPWHPHGTGKARCPGRAN